MAKLTVEAWEVTRAAAYVRMLEASLFEGVGGADALPAIAAAPTGEALEAMRRGLRQSAYGLLRAVRSRADWQAFDDSLGGPGYTNAWQDYGGAELPGGFLVDASGAVELRGVIKSGSLATPIVTMPEPLLPEGPHHWVCACSPGFALVTLTAAGELLVSGYGASGSNGFLSLCGVRWYPALRLVTL